MRARLTPALAALSILAMTLASASAAHAAPGEWDEPVIVSVDERSVSAPQLVTDGSLLTAVWSIPLGDPPSPSIQVATSADDGATWTEPVTISGDEGDASDPRIVTDGETITVVWAQTEGGFGAGLQSSYSDDGGETWSAPATITDEATSTPEVVRDGERVIAVWSVSSFVDDTFSSSVESAVSLDGGETWSTPETLSDSGESAGSARIVNDGATTTVVWRDSSANLVRVSTTDDGGDTWNDPVAVSDDETSTGDRVFPSDPAIATDGTTIVVSWTAQLSFELDPTIIQASTSTDGGQTWSDPTTVSTEDLNPFGSQLVVDGSTITATWYDLGSFPGSGIGVQVSTSTDRGATWSDPVTLSPDGEGGDGVRIVRDDTSITITWYDASSFPAGPILVSSSTDEGATWSEPVALSEEGANATSPQLVTNGSTVTVIWAGVVDFFTFAQVSSFTYAETDSPADPGTPSPESELAETGPESTLTLIVVAAGLLFAGAAFIGVRVYGRQTTSAR